MGTVDEDKSRHRLPGGPMSVSSAFEGSGGIAEARALARAFLADVQGVLGLTVSDRALDIVQLVVSELVTNAGKFAPGPCLLTLEVGDGAVDVTVSDSEPALPMVRASDPARVGQHGLEIVMAVCRSFGVHRGPLGKRIVASVALADDPDGNVAGWTG